MRRRAPLLVSLLFATVSCGGGAGSSAGKGGASGSAGGGARGGAAGGAGSSGQAGRGGAAGGEGGGAGATAGGGGFPGMGGAGGLGVGCRTPVAGHATLAGGTLTLAGLVGRPDASEMIHESLAGAPRDARAIGAEVARRLIARGAGQILRELEGR